MNLLAISKFLSLAASFSTIGLLLAMGFFLIDTEGKLGNSARKLRSFAAISATIWGLATGLSILATLANILGTNFAGALDPTSMRSFVTQIALGKYMFVQMCLALLVASIVFRIRSVASSNALLLLSMVALVAPVLESHSGRERGRTQGGKLFLAHGTHGIHGKIRAQSVRAQPVDGGRS